MAPSTPPAPCAPGPKSSARPPSRAGDQSVPQPAPAAHPCFQQLCPAPPPQRGEKRRCCDSSPPRAMSAHPELQPWAPPRSRLGGTGQATGEERRGDTNQAGKHTESCPGPGHAASPNTEPPHHHRGAFKAAQPECPWASSPHPAEAQAGRCGGSQPAPEHRQQGEGSRLPPTPGCTSRAGQGPQGKSLCACREPNEDHTGKGEEMPWELSCQSADLKA